MLQSLSCVCVRGRRSYASFREKGLDEVRQRLRHEHYEDKRKLKVRAIENVILTCNQKS